MRPLSTASSASWEVHRTARRSRDWPTLETPEDLGARLRVRNGCVTHIDMGLMRCGPLRPTIGLGTGKTPLEGLVLGGSGMHPGGGVTGLQVAQLPSVPSAT